jgi:hypothetical protein
VNVQLSLGVMEQGGHPQMTPWSKGGQRFYDESIKAE